ncbi:MAG: DUF3987 domain-containing protein [Bacilli bacterium]|nr:DUF3987 domain-containing protein [Bacilli bacterium]
MNMPFKIYYSNCIQQYNNCLYPNEIDVADIESLKKTVSHDYVCAKYKDNYRSIDNFISSNCVGVDFDNDHSNNPDDWVTSASIKEMFSGVPYLVHYSKSHMKPKVGKGKTEYGPRPRFHVIFLIDGITNADEYKAIKERLYDYCPLIDPNAKDSARFLAGTTEPLVEYHEGTITLNKFLDDVYSEKAFRELGEVIPEGSRNATMHKIACSLLVKYGISDESKSKYREASSKCNPPLEKDELNLIWKSAAKFYKNKVVTNPSYTKPEKYNKPTEIKWDTPIPFEKPTLPTFPVDALPKIIKDYVVAVAETTQTPVDMAATASLAIMSLCMQGRYKVIGKADWNEPVNLYTLIIAEPSERKSAIISFMTRPVNEYELNYNNTNAGRFEASRMRKSALESKKQTIETQYAKGKASETDLTEIAEKVANFKEEKPKKLYVDDITTEKLTSILSDSGGKTAIISTEGGIFDVLAGMYNKSVNIDVFLKGYSGDTIRVDRIGRPSELIQKPALTILLSVQPSVLSQLISNSTFEGKGLTTRFLYALPESLIGKRKFHTSPIPPEVSRLYDMKIKDVLNEEENLVDNQIVRLSSEASSLFETFHDENEKIMGENTEIKTWRGKLVGNVLRISALLARFNKDQFNPFFDITPPLVVSKEDMANAILIGRYYIEHAKASYSLMGIDPINKQAEYVLTNIKKNGFYEFSKRDILRASRSYKTVDAITPVLNRLVEYGYIQVKQTNKKTESYLSNPIIFNQNNKEEK